MLKKNSFNIEKTMIGSDKIFLKIIKSIQKISLSNATILLQGETGTGKELIANLIHKKSFRKNKPFIPVHCMAISPNLIESELFGHEKGSFTGAIKTKKGYFEASHKGTLFLDEIGELDQSIQIKLLRFLEKKEVIRVGSFKPIKINTRLICATNKNLRDLVKKKVFRDDLYYRLNVIPITLPPLRNRKNDILKLISFYNRKYNQSNKFPSQSVHFDQSAIKALKKYPWPGNIRELKNFCRRISILYSGKKLKQKDIHSILFKESIISLNSYKQEISQKLNNNFNNQEIKNFKLKKIIRDKIKQVLLKVNGNKSKAAKLLGISRKTIYRKIK
jgi:two-component system response regulator AtoC